MFRTNLYRKTALALSLCVGALLSACSATTSVFGTVTDVNGQALAGASITLQHTEQFSTTTQTDVQGRYNINLRESCFLVCAGGNPSLTAQVDGYTMASTYVPQIEQSEHSFVLNKTGSSPAPSPDDEMSRIHDKLPADFNANGVYGVDEESCIRHGGTMISDGNGIDYCDLGKVLAVFKCAGQNGPELVSLIDRPDDQTIIKLGSGTYETLTHVPSGSGEKLEGEHVTFWSKGDEARMMTVNGDVKCQRVKA